MSVLAVEDIGIGFGGVTALGGVSFAVDEGEIFAIIGPNGAGKTTLFNIVSGVYIPGRGRVTLGGRNVTGLEPHLLAQRGLSRTFQNLQIFFRMTAAENVMVGRHLHEGRNVIAHLFSLPSVLRQDRRTREKAEELLAFVGLAASANESAGSLPYGSLRRLEIARALATEPKVLLLDEPAAGCNPGETDQLDFLIRKIAAAGVTVVLVEHNMKLVMKISSRIHVLDRGRTLAEGTAAEVRSNEAVITAYLGTRERAGAHHARG
jgi:branched-chain amino acid transport system ATP-binding protein